MQAESQMVTRGGYTAIGFEQVVFERAGDVVDIVVSGMTAGDDPELVVFQSPQRASVSAMGSPGFGDQRRFTVRVTLDVAAALRITVCGEGGCESVTSDDLPDGLAVVCTADPSDPTLPDTFLHRRGDRYVLMTQPHLVHTAHVA